MQRPERHVARQQESRRSNFIAIHVGEASPLHTIKAQYINAFAHTGKTGVGVGIRIGIVGENGCLLCFDINGCQHHDKEEGYMD